MCKVDSFNRQVAVFPRVECASLDGLDAVSYNQNERTLQLKRLIDDICPGSFLNELLVHESSRKNETIDQFEVRQARR